VKPRAGISLPGASGGSCGSDDPDVGVMAGATNAVRTCVFHGAD
jgi:hypothetical protein